VQRFLRAKVTWRLTALALLLLPAAVLANTITVNTNADNATAGDSSCTLREAINNANSDSDTTSGDCTAGSGTDTIQFNIPGVGVHITSPTSALPALTAPVVINGYSQSGSSVNTGAFGAADNAVLTIRLDGAGAGTGVSGLVLSAGSDGTTIKGLSITNFKESGFTSVDGDGIDVQSGGNTIIGNFIGVTPGNTAAGNGADGIRIKDGANNKIGTPAAADRNLISANGQANVFAGLEITGTGATGNLVQGNYVGTDATGAAAMGNSTTFGYGIIIFGGASTNTIGGTAAGAGNVVSGNGGGITLQGGLQTLNQDVVQGNRIGTNAAGTAAVANLFMGIGTVAFASGTVIGGTAAGAGNLISGNTTDGIGLYGSNGTGTRVEGNLIGTDVTGTSAIPNGGSGVFIEDDSGSAVIGGMAAGTANTIAFNTKNGVNLKVFFAPGPQGFAILGNSIHDNGQLGIDLNNDGVTANDGGDGDTGPNGLQNFPVLTSASSNGVHTIVAGTLNSTANTTFRVEFFASPSCDASGNGEGRTFLGAASVTTDGSGNANINATFPVGSTGVLTATATDPTNDTSEFSACNAISAVADNAPVAVGDAYSAVTNGQLNVSPPGVLGNDSDADGDPITAVLDASPAHGTVLLNPDGSFTYTPNLGYSGPDSFSYHATDGVLNSNIATVNLTVAPLTAEVPMLEGWGLLLLAAGLVVAALLMLRR
jgi:CSLREA domain-containing protein